jgi:uncharacterized membrane protein YqjE
MDQVLTEEGKRPVGDLVRDLVGDIEKLLRSEVRLAKAELTEKTERAAKAGGSLGGAAAAALLGGMCLVATCVAALATAMAVWLAALIMGVLLVIAAGMLYARGRSILRNFRIAPEQTVETLKEDAEWMKNRTK